MNNKVTDLTTSRKLSTIMVGVETEKVWHARKETINDDWEAELYYAHEESSNLGTPYDSAYVPCYDMADLMGKLPNTVTAYNEDEGRNVTCELTIKKDCAMYCNDTTGHVLMEKYDDNITHATADLLLWVHEQGYGEGR